MLFVLSQCWTFFDSLRSLIFGVKCTKFALVLTIALTMGPYVFRRPWSAKKPRTPHHAPRPQLSMLKDFLAVRPPSPPWNSMLGNVAVENRAASRPCRANRPVQATASPRSRPFDVEISSQHWIARGAGEGGKKARTSLTKTANMDYIKVIGASKRYISSQHWICKGGKGWKSVKIVDRNFKHGLN